ncbi:MAG: DUF2029 domain-containing protein [Actinobacteria bacterium]|nr:DUF2029 domain-containing protein [Actinomycetota bacterium]
MTEQRSAGKHADWRLASALATVWLIMLLFGAAVIQPWRSDVPLKNDFVSFWTGSMLVRDGVGANLYDMAVQSDFQANLRRELTGSAEMKPGVVLDPFHSPPAQAVLMMPLTFLPLPMAYLLWSALSLGLFWLSVALPLRGSSRGATIAVLLLSFAGVADTLIFGQVNALFAIGISAALLAFRSRRPFQGGLWLGLLWLKPQYAVIFPVVFLLKRRWSELGGMVISGAVLAGVSLAVVGIDGAFRYLIVTREIGAFYPPPDSFIFPQSMVNWRGLLMNVWPGIPGDLGSIVMLALDALTAVVSLLVWRGPWEPESPRFGWQFLAATIATIVISPHSNFHGMVLMLGPMALTLSRPTEGAPLHRVWNGLLVAGYVMALAIWPFKVYSWLLVPIFLAAMAVLIVRCHASVTPPSGRPVLHARHNPSSGY